MHSTSIVSQKPRESHPTLFVRLDLPDRFPWWVLLAPPPRLALTPATSRPLACPVEGHGLALTLTDALDCGEKTVVALAAQTALVGEKGRA